MLENFWSKYNKVIILAGIIIFTAIIGFLIFTFFFKPLFFTTEAPGGEQATTTVGGFPVPDEGGGQIVDETQPSELPIEEGGEAARKPSPVARGGITQVTALNDSPSLAPTLSSNGQDIQYYDKNDGKFYKIDNNGELTLMSDKVFHNVETVVWSPKKNKAILEYPDGANIVYDFDRKTQVTLPSHWEDFSYSPDGNNIVMKSLGMDPDNRWLAISNENGSQIKAIEDIGMNDDKVYPVWSNNKQIIAMHTEGIDFNRQEVFFMGQNNENFKSTVIEGRDFRPMWSPKGDKLLYSVYSSDTDLKPMLWIVNAQGNNIGTGRKRLNVETWADKCVYRNDTELYCAVPETLETGAGLFPELAKTTKDRLYKIDTITGAKTLVAIPDSTYNMSNLVMSENGYYLYFTDFNSEKIHKIKLK